MELHKRSGALLSDQTIPHYVPQEILHIDDIPNEDETSMYSEKPTFRWIVR